MALLYRYVTLIDDLISRLHAGVVRAGSLSRYSEACAYSRRGGQSFGDLDGNSNPKLKAIPGWPYLSNVRICEARSGHVQRLVTAALASGYSPPWKSGKLRKLAEID